MTEQSPIVSLANTKAPRALPAWTYRNPELNEIEYELVFRPSWQFVCHVNQVKNVGDFVTFDLLRDSVLVVRGKDGELRAFMNVCRHRGAKLLDGAGHCKARMTCPYHGWSYNLRGELAGMPAEKTFPGADKKELGLKTIEIEVIVGLVFVRIVPGGPSLKEMWADCIHLLEPYKLEEMVPLDEPWIDQWACNWKVGVDNNLENYHVQMGHPGYDRMLDTDLNDGFMNKYGVAGSTSVLSDKLSSNWSERRYQQMAPELNENLPEDVRSNWMFFTMPPNIGIDIYGDSMDVFQFLPLSAESCTVRYPIFVRPDARREMKVLRYLNARINRQVSAEDKTLSERVQIGLNSHGFEFGPLSSYESCIHDFHDRVRTACPVADLAQAPSQGSLRRTNDEMLRARTGIAAA
jgi:phenylpropionate dioxygenase-like ring-hydroxylating dioxygenase large terminal subunit